MSTTDPRKVMLDFLLDATTGLSNAALTKDDDSTQVAFDVMYAYPDYPLTREFRAAANPVDLLFLVDTPTVRTAGVKVRYIESIPVTVACIDKTGITGTKLRWKAEKELRRVIKAFPLGSFHSMDRSEPSDERLGSTIVHSITLTANIRRTAS